MTFTKVPKESKNQIDKAGKILLKSSPGQKDFDIAIGLVERWRACHMYPINTFRSTLICKLKKFTHNPIAAQRLKRMPTIINKLRIYRAMQLTTMQDIAGVRAVVSSIKEVYKLAEEYRDESIFKHELLREKDYIKEPRDEDGYRSLHLIYKYKNSQARHYNGLLLELQIRTKLQHTWATAVETMGTFLGQALKSRQGDKEWINFFAITSSAFAYLEGSTLVPRFNHLSKDDTFKLVAASAEEINALEKMRDFSAAVNAIVRKRDRIEKKWYYHLIVLNSLEKTIGISSYARNDFKSAVAAYESAEGEAIKGAKIEPILVSAGPLAILKKAYPNFFLDINVFINYINRITSLVKTRKG